MYYVIMNLLYRYVVQNVRIINIILYVYAIILYYMYINISLAMGSYARMFAAEPEMCSKNDIYLLL